MSNDPDLNTAAGRGIVPPRDYWESPNRFWKHEATKLGDTKFQDHETLLTIQETWTIGAGIDYIEFLFYARYPRKGSLLRTAPAGNRSDAVRKWLPYTAWFTCTDSQVSDIKRTNSNELCVVITSNYAGPAIPAPEEEKPNLEREMLPWHIPLKGYAPKTEAVEEAVTILYGKDNLPKPFTTSAGSPFSLAQDRNILSFGFSYALPEKAFSEEKILQYKGKINANAHIKIADVWYKRGMVKIVDLSVEKLDFEHDDYSVDKYWNVSIQLSIDPKTWWRQYANVSTFFIPEPGKAFTQIWTTETESYFTEEEAKKYDADHVVTNILWGEKRFKDIFDYFGNKIVLVEGAPMNAPQMRAIKHFGSYDQMSALNVSKLQEVTEPLWLFPDSTLLKKTTTDIWRENPYFDYTRPNQFGDAVDATGGILPFDRETGQQFLGYFYRLPADSNDKYTNPKPNPFTETETDKKERIKRFGHWYPMAFNLKNKLVDAYDYLHKIKQSDKEYYRDTKISELKIDHLLIHETFIEGYKELMVDFTPLHLPKDFKMRWNENYDELNDGYQDDYSETHYTIDDEPAEYDDLPPQPN